MASTIFRHRFFRVAGVLLILVVMGQLFAHFYAGAMLAGRLEDKLSRSSSGIYSIKYDAARFNLFSSTLWFSDIHIQADTAKYYQFQREGKGSAQLIELWIPRLNLRGMSVWDAFNEDELKITRLEIRHPKLNLIHHPQVDKRGIKKHKFDLKDLVKGRFSTIKIEQFDVIGGRFIFNDQRKFSQNAFKAKDIAIQIQSLKIDSTSSLQKDQSFEAEAIVLGGNVEDYSFVMPDSSYEFSIGSIGFSTAERAAFAGNVSIKARPEHFQKTSKSHKHLSEAFNVEAEQLRLEGFDFKEVFFERKLKLAALRLVNPHIQMIGNHPDSLGEERQQKIKRSLYDQVSPAFKSVEIGEIKLENGTFLRCKSWQDSSLLAKVEQLNIELLYFKLDSTSGDKLLLSDDIRLEGGRHAIRLGESDYQLEGKSFWLSTQSRFLTVDSLRLMADPEAALLGRSEKKRDLYDVLVPNFVVEGVDANKVWFDREVDVNKIVLSAPVIRLTNYPNVKKEQLDRLARRDLYDLISGQFKSLKVREFELTEGQFLFNDDNQFRRATFRAHDLAILIKGFQLAPGWKEASTNPFYAEAIKMQIDVDNYSFMLPDSSHELSIHKIGFSSKDSLLFADSIHFRPTRFAIAADTLQTSFHLRAPKIKLKGFDFLDWYFNRKLKVNAIVVENPELFIDQKENSERKKKPFVWEEYDVKKILTQNLSSIDILNFEIRNAELHRHIAGNSLFPDLFIPSIDFQLSHFQIDSLSKPEQDKFLYAEDVSLKFSDLNQSLPDGIHHLKLKQFLFSTAAGEIQLDSLLLRPKATISKTHAPNEYHFGVARLKIKGVDATEMLRDRLLHVDSICFTRPDLRFVNYPDIPKELIDSLAKSDLYQLISTHLLELRVDGFQIDDGKFYFHDERDDPKEDLNVTDIELMVSKFQLDSVARTKTDNPFYAQDIALNFDINRYGILLPDSSYRIGVGRVSMKEAGKRISLDSLELTPLLAANPSTEFLIPKLELDGVKIPEIYFDHVADLSSVRLSNPRIIVLQPFQKAKKIKKSKPIDPFRSTGLYETIEPWLDTLHVSNFSIDQGLFRAEQDSMGPLLVPNFSLSLENFHLDRFSRVKRLFYSDDFELQLYDLRRELPDSMYSVRISKVGIQSCGDQVYMDSVKLIPRYSTDEFGRKKGHAVDRMAINIPSVRMKNADMWTFFTTTKFGASEINLFQPVAHIYRDNRLVAAPHGTQADMPALMRKLRKWVDVKKLSLWDGQIDYQTISPEGEHPGIVRFSEMNLTINGLDKKLAERGEKIVNIEGDTRMMQNGKLRIAYSIPLDDASGIYSYTGVLEGPMYISELNPMLEPAAFVSVKNGILHKLNFAVTADACTAEGKMRIYYNELKVSVINKKKKGTFKGFESFLANSFALRGNNPRRKFFRVGRIYYERDSSKSVFNYWVKSLLRGVTSSIGLHTKEDRIKNLFKWGKKEDE